MIFNISIDGNLENPLPETEQRIVNHIVRAMRAMEGITYAAYSSDTQSVNLLEMINKGRNE
jgi:hypothetical protein